MRRAFRSGPGPPTPSADLDAKPGSRLGNRPDPPLETRWKPGQSGNPSGRRKTKPLTDALERLLPKQVPPAVLRSLRLPGLPKSANVTWADVAAHGLLLAAARGRVEASREVADRVEGRVPQAISGSLAVFQLRELFEQMNVAELETYASTGALPEWFGERRPLLLPSSDEEGGNA
jgi:Family of unknown function (DUF5681)